LDTNRQDKDMECFQKTNKVMKLKYYLVSFCLICALELLFLPMLYSQDEEFGKITEGEFAVRLVKMMRLERSLPSAPLQADYVDLLEMIGLSPLIGWDQDRLLTRDNYAIIIAMAAGKEKLVWEKAQEVCDHNVEAINNRWELKRDLDRRPSVSLKEILEDKTYFPAGPPKCPYGRPYRAIDGKVKKHSHKTFKSWLTWWGGSKGHEEKMKSATAPLPETKAVKEAEGGRLGDVELTPHGQ
jgi:hypothetical protein